MSETRAALLVVVGAGLLFFVVGLGLKAVGADASALMVVMVFFFGLVGWVNFRLFGQPWDKDRRERR